MTKTSAARNSEDSLADRAYLVIREQILRGELSIGSPVSRRQLAETLKTSILPVGEALQRLEREGFVETRRRAGTRVRVFTADEIRDQYILREALESQAARLVAERASLQQLHELHRMAEQVDILFKRSMHNPGDSEFLFSVHNQHFQFHMRIAEYGMSKALRDEIETKQVLMFNWFYMVAAPDRILPAHFHADLAEALRTRNPETADRAMRRHVRYGLEELVASLQPLQIRKWRSSGPFSTPVPVRRGNRMRRAK
jgi:GntR family transcriptional regulator, rspAB operon transcriptional repressor